MRVCLLICIVDVYMCVCIWKQDIASVEEEVAAAETRPTAGGKRGKQQQQQSSSASDSVCTSPGCGLGTFDSFDMC